MQAMPQQEDWGGVRLVAVMTATGPQEAAWWRCDVSLFKHAKSARPTTRSVSWDSLCSSLTRFRPASESPRLCKTFGCYGQRDPLDPGPCPTCGGETCAKIGTACWSPAVYPAGENRAKARVVAVSCLVLDYDDGTTLRAAHNQWREYPHVLHTSWSHRKEHHKCRVIVPLLRPIPPEHYARAWHWALTKAPQIDKQCSDPSRVWFVPSHPAGASGAWAKAWSPDAGFLALDPESLPPTPAEVKAEAMRNRPPRRVGFGQGKGAAKRAVSEALKTQESARVTAAQQLGATITTGVSPRADHIPCP